jgi:hypothetical protein
MTLEALREANPGKNIRSVMWREYCPESAEKPPREYMFWIRRMWREYFAEVYDGKEQYAHAANYDKFHKAFDEWLFRHLKGLKSNERDFIQSKAR